MIEEAVLNRAVKLWQSGKTFQTIADELHISLYCVWMAVRRFNAFGTTKHNKHNNKHIPSVVTIRKLRQATRSMLAKFPVDEYGKVMDFLQNTIDTYRQRPEKLEDFLSDLPSHTDNNKIETVAECKLEKFEFIAIPIHTEQLSSSLPQIESFDKSPPTDEQLLKEKNILECKVLVKKLDLRKIKKTYRLTESGTFVKRTTYSRWSPSKRRRKFIKKASSLPQIKTSLKVEPTDVELKEVALETKVEATKLDEPPIVKPNLRIKTNVVCYKSSHMTKFDEKIYEALESRLAACIYIQGEDLRQFAKSLNLKPVQVQRWFSHKRTKNKLPHTRPEPTEPTHSEIYTRLRRHRSTISVNETRPAANLNEAIRYATRRCFSDACLVELEKQFSVSPFIRGLAMRNLCAKLNKRPLQISKWFYLRRRKSHAFSRTTAMKLLQVFRKNKSLNERQMERLAVRLNLTTAQVRKWFYYERLRTQKRRLTLPTLDHDYTSFDENFHLIEDKSVSPNLSVLEKKANNNRSIHEWLKQM